MSFDDALKIIRMFNNYNSVWFGLEYDGDYVFLCSNSKTVNVFDITSYFRVDKTTGDVYNFIPYSDENRINDFNEALKNKILIDASKYDVL